MTTFNVEIGITGAILTKLDGDSRGGAALSVKEVGSSLSIHNYSVDMNHFDGKNISLIVLLLKKNGCH